MVATRRAKAVSRPSQDFWQSPDGAVSLLRGDSLEVLAELEPDSIDVVFADPPYFLSNGGTACQSGRRVSVDKGKWDQSRGIEENHEFNKKWLALCQRVLTPNGTIWVSGTSHVIHSVGFAMQQLGFKMLNDIIWEKPNPPPNLSCRYFTHSTETVLWAAKGPKSKHHFDYPEMRIRNENKQMKSVWRFTAPGKREKVHGKHPTQKPLGLLDRILAASCPEGGRVLDPFNGSGTTGVAAATLGLPYTGIDLDKKYLELTRKRLLEARPDWADAGTRRKLKVAAG
jgi:site-specific DNA-methyltransferase (adenine-specific)